MTLTDDEAREIVNTLGFKTPCFLCCGLGTFDDIEGNPRFCAQCEGWGYLSKNRRLITLLESRIGT